MCFKKLRSLKNLCNFTPEDFEYKPSYSSQLFKMRTDSNDEETKSYEFNFPFSGFYDPPKPTSYNVDIKIVPKEPVTYVADWDYSKDGETAASQGISKSAVDDLLNKSVLLQDFEKKHQIIGGGEHALLLPAYSFNPLCNLKGHNWVKEFIELDEPSFMHKYCLRCWKVSYKEEESN